MRKKIFETLKIIQPFFALIRDIFPYVLLLYLVFFLLENLFTGIVSNNIDLNYVLVAVMIVGFLSVFAPLPEQQEEPPQKNDLYIIAGLTLMSFFILFFKTRDMGMEGFGIALGGSILVAGMAAVIMYSKDDEDQLQDDQVSADRSQQDRFSQKVHAVHSSQLNQLTKIKFIIPFFIVLMIIASLLLYMSRTKKAAQTSQEKIFPTITPALEEAEEIIIPDKETLQNTPIEILNGSLKIGSASAMGKFLQEKGFNVVKAGNANSSDYENLSIRFRPEEYEMVKYLISVVQGIYPNVIREPLATDSAKIIMILGKP